MLDLLNNVQIENNQFELMFFFVLFFFVLAIDNPCPNICNWVPIFKYLCWDLFL